MKKTKQEVLDHVISFHGITGVGTYPMYDAYNAVKPAHIKYGSPWCAIFVWFALQDQLEYIPCEASCDRMKEDLKKNGRWYAAGSKKPVPGDLIFFSSKLTEADCTHVGIVMQCDYYTEILTTYEGNTSKMVAPRMYRFTDNPYIVGYGDLQDLYLT